MEWETYFKTWTHKSLESGSCYRVFWKQCFVGIHTMLIGDTFLPLFGLDQDRICFISEIALDCAMVRFEKRFPQNILQVSINKKIFFFIWLLDNSLDFVCDEISWKPVFVLLKTLSHSNSFLRSTTGQFCVEVFVIFFFQPSHGLGSKLIL